MNNLIKLSAVAAGFALFAILPASTVYAGTGFSDYISDEFTTYDSGYLIDDYDFDDSDLLDDYDDNSGRDILDDYISLDDYDSSDSCELLDLDDLGSQSAPSPADSGNEVIEVTDLDDLNGATAPVTVVAPEPEPAADAAAGNTKITSDMSRALGTINSMRAKKGAGKLVFNEDLNRVAALRAQEAIRKFSHTRPNGRAGITILFENGITYGVAGENLACVGSSAESAVAGWASSSAHRSSMLESCYRQAGLGSATVNGTTVWVLFLTD
ncbi:MAG: CAP domain-containing protein [Lachnospiraceae bacterium]|nr:CAP domain-containing protein [Lachnospiraceae bacterium]